MTHPGIRTAAVLTITIAAAQAARAQDAGYVITDTIRIERQGALFLDAPNRRLYITQVPFERFGAGAVVVNTLTNTMAGRLTLAPEVTSVSAIAFAPELGKGWASNGDERTVTPFNLQTYATDKDVRVPDTARMLAYDSVSKRLFVLSRRDVFVIEAASGAVSTINVGDRISHIEVDGKGKLFVSVADPGSGTVVVIDTKTAKETSRFKVDKCGAPSRFALDPASGHVFTNCSNRAVAVSSHADGKLLATIPARINVSRLLFDARMGLLAPINTEDVLSLVTKDAAGAYAAAGTAVALPKLRVTDIRHDVASGKVYVSATGSTGKDFRVLVLNKK